MRNFTFALLLLLPVIAPAQTSKATMLITGQVLDENGKPVAGAGVSAHPDALSGKLPMSVTDNEGRFTIQVYKPGRYRIGAHKPNLSYPSTINPFYYPATAGTDQATVEWNAPPPFVTVRFAPRAGKLMVQVSDQDTHAPIRNVQIVLCRADAPRHCFRQNLSSRDGLFPVLTSSDRVFMEVYAEGYQDGNVPDERESKPRSFAVPSNTSTQVNISLKQKTSNDDSSSRLKAPEQLSPENGTELVHFPRTTELVWMPVPGAASYTVEIDFCDGLGIPENCRDPHPMHHMLMPPTSGIEATTYKFAFLGAQPARWRVWAVDGNGNPGRKSGWFLFFYRE